MTRVSAPHSPAHRSEAPAAWGAGRRGTTSLDASAGRPPLQPSLRVSSAVSGHSARRELSHEPPHGGSTLEWVCIRCYNFRCNSTKGFLKFKEQKEIDFVLLISDDIQPTLQLVSNVQT